MSRSADWSNSFRGFDRYGFELHRLDELAKLVAEMDLLAEPAKLLDEMEALLDRARVPTVGRVKRQPVARASLASSLFP